MDWQTHKKILLKNPEFRKLYEETEPERQIALDLIEARLNSGLSQQQLADRMHTKQSVISRVESAQTMPSLAFVKRLATSLNVSFHVHITP